MLQELFVERASSRGIVGNVYLGRILRVLPGMQAAFVDIGLDRAAFLHASDISTSRLVLADEPAALPDGSDTNSHGNGGSESITRLVYEGQELMVQVIKDPIGGKGARLTTHLSIPACFLVFLPDGDGVGISQRIDDLANRDSLRADVTRLVEQDEDRTPGGYIVRTAAESARPGQLEADMVFLKRLWRTIASRSKHRHAPSLVYEDLPLPLRTLREMVGLELDRIRVDSRESYKRMKEFTHEFLPELHNRIEHYPGERPIFDLYGTDEMNARCNGASNSSLEGHLVIDQTEAMTTIRQHGCLRWTPQSRRDHLKTNPRRHRR